MKGDERERLQTGIVMTRWGVGLVYLFGMKVTSASSRNITVLLKTTSLRN